MQSAAKQVLVDMYRERFGRELGDQLCTVLFKVGRKDLLVRLRRSRKVTDALTTRLRASQNFGTTLSRASQDHTREHLIDRQRECRSRLKNLAQTTSLLRGGPDDLLVVTNDGYLAAEEVELLGLELLLEKLPSKAV
jgi:hypothetical protein